VANAITINTEPHLGRREFVLDIICIQRHFNIEPFRTDERCAYR
jgi:hypothetical protein